MTRRPARRPGMITYATLFVILGFLALLATVWNAHRTAHRKMEAQNAADAAAHAAGLQAARALNQVTAANHLIGELLALCNLAYAPGGTELEDYLGGKTGGGQFDLAAGIQPELTAAHESARVWGELARRPVVAGAEAAARTTRSDSGAAIGHARRRLKHVLAWAYRLHAAGAVLVAEPDLNMATQGDMVLRTAEAVERAVAAEWAVLDALERVAKEKLLPLKWLCNHTLIPALYQHAKQVVGQTPGRMEAAAAERAAAHDTAGTLFPNTAGRGRPLALPLVTEDTTVRDWASSQLVRAATPWVQYWRKPVLDFADEYLVLSRYGDFYLEWCQHFTPLMARWQGEDYGTYLYVLTDAGGGKKGQEGWTRRAGSRRADALFGTLGLAHQPAPAMLGGPFFRRPQPDGNLAFAQAMVYNANPQDPDRPPPAPLRPDDWQPVVGWDTLNWDPAVWVPEHGYGKERDRGGHVRQPRVRVNWRVTLVPATLLGDAAGSQAGPADRIIRRTAADAWPANTH